MCVISREETDREQEGVCLCAREKKRKRQGGGVSAGFGLSFYDMIGCVRER